MQFKKTAKTVWIIYSLAGILPVLVAFIVPRDALLGATPACYSIKQFGHECFMCGSTRGFILTAEGNFAEAAAMNRLSLVLFFIIIANTIVLAYYLLTNKQNKI